MTAVAVALAPVVACSGAGEQGAAAAVDAGTADGGSVDGGSCAVGEMADVLAATNQAQIDATMKLRARLSAPKAVDLAEKMLTDHSLLLEELEGAVRAGEIETRSGGIGRALADSAEHERTAIAASSSLDSAYADHEVLWHLRDQALLDTVIAPAVRGTRLTFVVNSMRELEQQHVALALALQADLDSTCH